VVVRALRAAVVRADGEGGGMTDAPDEPAEDAGSAPSALTDEEYALALQVWAGRTDAQLATAWGTSEAAVRERITTAAFRVPGPGTARARLTRYVRGEQDTATEAAHRASPVWYLVDRERRAA
jgi:hypothetical protein